MSRNDPTDEEPVACPYLGLTDDPRTRFSFPAQTHRCHARSRPASIDMARQGAYCLSSRYPTCDRYHTPKAAANVSGDHRLSVQAAVGAEPEPAAEEAEEVMEPTVPEPPPEPAMEPAAPEAVPEPPASEPPAWRTGRGPTPSPPTAWRTSRQPTWESTPAPAPVAVATPTLPESPPRVRKTTESSTDLVAVFPWSQAAAAPPPSGSQNPGTDPIQAESAATVPPSGIRPTAPPPLAWKTATTSSVLASILPPAAPLSAPIPAESPAQAPHAPEPQPSLPPTEPGPPRPIAGVEPALPPRRFVVSTPVADARARLPASAPLVSAADAWPAATRDLARSSSTPKGSGRKRNVRRQVRRRALLLLIVLAVAALAALVVAMATGSLERWLPAGFLLGTIAVPSATGAGPTLANLIRGGEQLIIPPAD